MPSITKEQIIKINSKCNNDFKLDVERYVVWGEKTLEKFIALDNEGKKLLRVKLEYYPEYETIKQPNGVLYNQRTGQELPTLHLSVWNSTGTGMMTSHGLGMKMTVGEPQSRKVISILQKLTANYPNERVMEIYESRDQLTKEN